MSRRKLSYIRVNYLYLIRRMCAGPAVVKYRLFVVTTQQKIMTAHMYRRCDGALKLMPRLIRGSHLEIDAMSVIMYTGTMSDE